MKIPIAVLAGSLITASATATVPDFRASMETYIRTLPPGQVADVCRDDAHGYEMGRAVADELAPGTTAFASGLFLPVFGLVYLVDPGEEPPTAAVIQISPEHRDCFTLGYKHESAANKRGKGLLGAALGSAILLLSVAASQ